MILLVIGCLLIGISFLYLIKVTKLSSYILYSVPIGIVLNSFVFIALAYLKILYNKYYFLIAVIIAIILLIINIVKKKTKIVNDMKDIPIYYILILLYIIVRLIIVAGTSYFDFYNCDEFTAYTKYSKMMYVDNNFSGLIRHFTLPLYFISTMTYSINNVVDLASIRTIMPLFFGLVSLFIYCKLKDAKVNRNVSALLALLFLVSSSENMVLAKVFYTNIPFAFYIVSGLYLLGEYYLINKGKKFPIISIVLLIGATLTRLEGIYLIICAVLFLFIISICDKRASKSKIGLFVVGTIIFRYLLKFSNNLFKPAVVSTIAASAKRATIMETFKINIQSENLKSFFENLYDQTFANSYYNYNFCIFFVFIISIVLLFIYVIKHKKQKDNYSKFFLFLFLSQLAYIGIVFATQMFIMNPIEFKVAASFSRYVMQLLPISFIIVGIILFKDTDFKLLNIKKYIIKMWQYILYLCNKLLKLLTKIKKGSIKFFVKVGVCMFKLLNKIKDFLINHKIFIIFAIFFLLVFLQHYYMGLYHDDYGYASLSYAYVVDGVSGHNFSINQLFEFLIGHYNIWGGRILYFAIEILLISKSLFLFKLVQSIIITFIFYFIYKIIKKLLNNKLKQNDWIIALFSVALYGIFEIEIINRGIMWPTASVLYVFPILPLFAFIYLYLAKKEKGNSKIYLSITSFLIFMATFSQEQVSTLTLFLILGFTVIEYLKDKKIDKRNILWIIFALLGFAILMLAPGNTIRANDVTNIAFNELNIFGKIIKNLPIIFTSIFSNENRYFILVIFLVSVYTNVKNLKIKNKFLNYINKLSMISNIVVLAGTYIFSDGYLTKITGLFNYSLYYWIVIIIFIGQIILLLYTISLYIINKKHFELLIIFYSGIISQLVMLVSPYYPMRSAIIIMFTCFIIIAYLFADIMKSNKNIAKILLIFVLFGSLMNLFTIIIGYRRNNWVNVHNDHVLREASKQIEIGEPIENITLLKLTDFTYSAEQPYMPGFEFIQVWMKQYYNLPENIIINYE